VRTFTVAAISNHSDCQRRPVMKDMFRRTLRQWVVSLHVGQLAMAVVFLVAMFQPIREQYFVSQEAASDAARRLKRVTDYSGYLAGGESQLSRDSLVSWKGSEWHSYDDAEAYADGRPDQPPQNNDANWRRKVVWSHRVGVLGHSTLAVLCGVVAILAPILAIWMPWTWFGARRGA
jgi:hypothetical protein